MAKLAGMRFGIRPPDCAPADRPSLVQDCALLCRGEPGRRRTLYTASHILRHSPAVNTSLPSTVIDPTETPFGLHSVCRTLRDANATLQRFAWLGDQLAVAEWTRETEEAETVYEAAIRGLAALRHHPWCGPQVSQRECILDVCPEGTGRVYRVTVGRLLQWLDSAGGRRGEFVHRYQLKRLLLADPYPNPRVSSSRSSGFGTPSGVSSTNCRPPRIDVSGVRSSWLTVVM